MSHATSSTTFERLSDQVKAGIERLLRETETDASDETLSTTAAELWDVVEEVEDVLETIDLEKLPDTVEVSALPDLLDLDELPNAIREKDPDAALDLSTLRHAIKLRELWNTVDLADFGKETRQLKAELEDVVGPDAFDSSGERQRPRSRSSSTR